MRSDTLRVYCNVSWDKLGKLFFVESLYAFKTSNLMVLFYQNDNRFKVFLYHAVFEKKTNQIGLLYRQMRTLAWENENLGC